ncbi:hypothetical protein JL721_7051 [Aureococcus anophagefferens]|nr:hypothetical protein JL721_7051 [Aureococcus anophagefferens]
MGASSAETTRRRLDGAGGDDAFATMAVATPVDEIATTTDSEAFFTTTACYAHPSPQAPFVPRASTPRRRPSSRPSPWSRRWTSAGARRARRESDLGGGSRHSAAPGGRLPPLPLDLSGRSLTSARRRSRAAGAAAAARAAGRAAPGDDPPPAYDAAYDPPPAYDDAPRQPSVASRAAGAWTASGARSRRRGTAAATRRRTCSA